MKYLPYILRNVTRNKRRTIFTGMSIAVSLFLVTVLYAYVNMQDEAADEASKYARVIVTAKQGLTFPVPIAHLDKVLDGRGKDRFAAGLVWRQIQGRQDPLCPVRHGPDGRVRRIL